MKSSNPFLKNSQSSNYQNQQAEVYNQTDTFSYTATSNFSTRGALKKSFFSILTLALMVLVITNTPVLLSVATALYLPLAIASIIGMIVMGIQVSKDHSKAKNLLYAYVAVEGILLSVIVSIANFYAPGAGITAAIITIGFVLLMSTLYNIAPGLIGAIQPVVLGAVAILAILMTINFVASIFGAGFLPYDSLVFVGILIAISALTISIDFRQIDMLEQAGVSKDMEYVAAFGLVTSVVWLYINVLRFVVLSRD